MKGERAMRRIALMLARHARRLLSRDHKSWADAMEAEIHAIADDRAALGWALGCVIAGYRETWRPLASAGTAIRLFLAAWLVYFAYANLLGPLQAIGCYAHLSKPALDMLAALPDDRIICVSWPAVPLPMLAISIAAGLLYAICAVQLVRARAAALWTFAAAFVLGWGAFLFEQGLPALDLYRASDRLGHIVEQIALSRAAIPALIAAAIWLIVAQEKMRLRA